jgi:hypothetical protein
VYIVTIKVLIIFVEALEGNLVNTKKWLQTFTNYENIAVTLCLMSIAILTNFDGIELHPIFLQTLMDFDGNQPIRILFWNEEMMFTKQKHMEDSVL